MTLSREILDRAVLSLERCGILSFDRVKENAYVLADRVVFRRIEAAICATCWSLCVRAFLA